MASFRFPNADDWFSFLACALDARLQAWLPAAKNRELGADEKILQRFIKLKRNVALELPPKRTSSKNLVRLTKFLP